MRSASFTGVKAPGFVGLLAVPSCTPDYVVGNGDRQVLSREATTREECMRIVRGLGLGRPCLIHSQLGLWVSRQCPHSQEINHGQNQNLLLSRGEG